MTFLDRRQASRRQEDHERDRLFELSADLLGVLGSDGRLRQVNASWERVTGWPTAQLTQQPFVDLIDHPDQPAMAAGLERLRQGGEQLSLECRCRTASGQPCWIQFTATPDAEFGVVYLTGRDVTGRRLAEAERGRLAAIVESSNDAIISASLAGTIESWNPAAERIFGYRASEVLGRPLTMLVPRLSTDMTPQMLGQVRSGEQVTRLEADRRRKDGTMVSVSLTLSPVRDAMGFVVATSVIAREAGQ